MPAAQPVSAAILCGGRGRRMGGVDKGHLPISGTPIVVRQLDVLRPLAGHVILVDRDGTYDAPAGVQVVADLLPDTGPVGGIYTALQTASTDHVIIVACDMPFITTALIVGMLHWIQDADVVIPRDDRGRPALCGVFHRRVAPVLRAQIAAGRLRLDESLARLAVRAIDTTTLGTLDSTGHLLANLNTQEDYRTALRGYDTP